MCRNRNNPAIPPEIRRQYGVMTEEPICSFTPHVLCNLINSLPAHSETEKASILLMKDDLREMLADNDQIVLRHHNADTSYPVVINNRLVISTARRPGQVKKTKQKKNTNLSPVSTNKHDHHPFFFSPFSRDFLLMFLFQKTATRDHISTDFSKFCLLFVFFL